MDQRKNNKHAKANAQRRKDREFVMFLADQEDIRDERGEFNTHGVIFKTMVEIRPADIYCPEDTWDGYVVVDGHFYGIGNYQDQAEADRSTLALRIRMEKMLKNSVANFMMTRKYD